MGNVYKVGVETRVSPLETTGHEQRPAIVTLENGGWLIVWRRMIEGGEDVLSQRYDQNGQPVGGPIAVLEDGEYGISPSVVALPDGGWIAFWADGSGIFQRKFDAGGIPVTDAVRVNTGTGTVNEPEVCVLPDGGWVVTWFSNQDGDIYQRVFDRNADPSPNGLLPIPQNTAGTQGNQQIAALANGDWVVTWQGNSGIYQRRFDADGDVVYDDVAVSTGVANQFPSIAGLSDGGWIVTWNGNGGIHQKRFDKNGEAADAETVVSGGGAYLIQSVTDLADGGWVVTWSASDGQGYGIYQKAFDKFGRATSDAQMLVNTDTSGAGIWPVVTALNDGSWVVAWQSDQSGNREIYQQRFKMNEAPSDLALSAAAVMEAAGNDTVIGTLSAKDADVAISGDTLTYTLLDDAGGRFALQGDKLVVADGLRLDHEQTASHTVRVRVADRDGLGEERTFTISVQNRSPEKITGSNGHDVLWGDVGADAFSGLGGNDRFVGADGRDRLDGGLGNDTLHGGYGNDILIGGKGKDAFAFTAKLGTSKTDRKVNFDTISDFKLKEDKIHLENAVFSKLKKAGKLSTSFFTIGDKAKDKNDYIVYNNKTGILSYDPDGSGAKKAIEFAKVKAKLNLKASDFLVI